VSRFPGARNVFSEIYEKERPGLDEYVSRFQSLDEQVGALFAINGEVVGLDSFDNPETLSRMFRNLVTSYALDAIDWLNIPVLRLIREPLGNGFLNGSRFHFAELLKRS